MKLQLAQKIPASFDVVVLVDDKHARAAGVPKDEFAGKSLTTCLTRAKKARVVYVGLGKTKDVHSRLIGEAVGKGVRELLGMSTDKVAIDLTHASAYVQQAAEGVLLGAYKFETFLHKDQKRKKRLAQVALVLPRKPTASDKHDLKKGTILAEACNMVREIGDSPPNVINPPALADHARKLASRCKLGCKIWNMAALRKEKFGGILAVGKGSDSEPRFIVLQYKVKNRKAPTIAVVGKAITFDTGGISLKPGPNMDEMKFDKMGGCAVLGIMEAVSKLKLPVNVIGVIASAENMPDGKAYRPGDIVTTWDGKTIEVLNTDAEGRIVLADALAYARVKFKPDLMIDMATLTGACVVALGHERAAMFTENDKAAEALHRIGETCGERVWRMPFGEEFDKMVESKIAKAKNIGGGRWGGSCSAASFLKVWAEGVPWVHLDIAGTGWTTTGYPHMEIGATGFGVRLVTQFIEQYK